MKILLVKNSVVPPIDYGGTERVVFWLAKSLKSLGHQVELLVAKGSQNNLFTTHEIKQDIPMHQQIPEGFDVIHFHDPFNYEINTPYICTIHGVADPGESYSKNAVFVSHNQARCHAGHEVVYHGIDFSEYGIYNKNIKKNYIHFLAKTRWKIKNIGGAIYTSMKANKYMEIMGNQSFEKIVLKNIFNKNIHFNGMAVGEKKNRIMAESTGLLFPTLCQETFGLSMIESMYHGCPVYGTPYGSLPELITSEVGFLSHKASELAYAIKHHDFDFDQVHQVAMDLYQADRMARDYIKVYEKVMNGNSLHAVEPTYQKEYLDRTFEFVFD